MAWICPCGKPIPDDAQSCRFCGYQLAPAILQSPPPAALLIYLPPAPVAVSYPQQRAVVTPAKKTNKFVLVLASVVLFIVVKAFMANSGKSGSSPGGTPAAEQQMPADEREFISTVEAFKARYEKAPNEYQKSTLRSERATEIARILPNLSARGWVGQISLMETTQDLRGILSVKLGDSSISIQTVNNEFSDLFAGTLIPHGSALYQEISGLAVGNTITFSGSFNMGELDYAREESVMEEGSMTEPEFIFTFTSVHPGAPPPGKTNEESSTESGQPTPASDAQPTETTPPASSDPVAPPDSTPAANTTPSTDPVQQPPAGAPTSRRKAVLTSENQSAAN